MVIGVFNKDKRFSTSEIVKGYIIEEILGEGRYGICYLVSKDGKKYILKQLKKKMLNKTSEKLFYEEEILKNLKTYNIPRYIETINEDFYGYILEYIEGKTMEEIIFKDKYVFDKLEIFSIGNKIINIIKYLHENKIVHRDIRIPNIIFRDGEIYLLDFGLARYINNKKYTADIDFSYVGDFLLHLYYTSYEVKDKKERPWYEELQLEDKEMLILKRLFGIEKKYSSIYEVQEDFSILGVF